MLMAAHLEIPVLRPVIEGARYDLVLDLDRQFLRVQCKLARHLSGVLRVTLRTNRCTPRGYVTSCYSAEEVDVITAYSHELHRAFLIPIDEAEGRRGIHLRLEPTLNNQVQGIKWARDYEFATMIERLRSNPSHEPRSRCVYTCEPTLGL